MKLLIAKHPEHINVQCKALNNQTPLHAAASNDRGECVSLLLSHSADVALENDAGETAFIVAQASGAETAVDAFMSAM